MFIQRALVIVASGLIPCGSGAADVIHVPGNHPTIQAAIDASFDGDEVIVAPGEYLENVSFNCKQITVRSSDPDDPAVVVATVIKSAGAGVDIVKINCGQGAATTLSGFVITGASDASALLIQGSSPTVTRCSFIDNSGLLGAAIRVASGSPTVTNCLFSGNSADDGGGAIYVGAGSPLVEHCAFSANTCSGPGGAVNAGGGLITASNCDFSGNGATWGGAIYAFLGNASCSDCTFIKNNGSLSGGAIYNTHGAVTVTDCVFSGNTTNGGGAVTTPGTATGSTTVTSSYFCHNTPQAIDGSYRDGGGSSLQFCPPPAAVKAKPACLADLNDDGVVNGLDLAILLGQWGLCLE